MPVIALWEIAAGLGVGAFFGVVFLAIVKRFGTTKGRGFETSKLGRETTAILAVLIVLLAGAATIVSIIIYGSNRSGHSTTTVPFICNCFSDEQRGILFSAREAENWVRVRALLDEGSHRRQYCEASPHEFRSESLLIEAEWALHSGHLGWARHLIKLVDGPAFVIEARYLETIYQRLLGDLQIAEQNLERLAEHLAGSREHGRIEFNILYDLALLKVIIGHPSSTKNWFAVAEQIASNDKKLIARVHLLKGILQYYLNEHKLALSILSDNVAFDALTERRQATRHRYIAMCLATTTHPIVNGVAMPSDSWDAELELSESLSRHNDDFWGIGETKDLRVIFSIAQLRQSPSDAGCIQRARELLVELEGFYNDAKHRCVRDVPAAELYLYDSMFETYELRKSLYDLDMIQIEIESTDTRDAKWHSQLARASVDVQHALKLAQQKRVSSEEIRCYELWAIFTHYSGDLGSSAKHINNAIKRARDSGRVDAEKRVRSTGARLAILTLTDGVERFFVGDGADHSKAE